MKKQTDTGWYITIAVFVAVAVVIVFISGERTHPGNSNNNINNLTIVSVAPSVTEMLFALGMQDCIIGVTDHCNYPPEAENIECIGGFGKPNIEKLLALRPDLVIATDFERNDVPEMLRKSGIRVLELRMSSFHQMFEALRQIGRATGKLQTAEEVVNTMQAQLKAIAERFEKVQPSQRPRVFVEIWYDPVTTAGRMSFVDEVITKAGGINVAHNINHAWPRINSEKVIEWDPDIIVLCYMEQKGCSASQLSKRIGWADISAVRQGRIIQDIPSDIILRPGPRLIEAVRALSQRFYETENMWHDKINE